MSLGDNLLPRSTSAAFTVVWVAKVQTFREVPESVKGSVQDCLAQMQCLRSKTDFGGTDAQRMVVSVDSVPSQTCPAARRVPPQGD